MTVIVGVDFSGHRDDRNTWVARGRLDAGGALWLDSVQPARRADVHDLLAAVATPAVAALDFPFGVPAAFAARLSPKHRPRAMPDLWQTLSGIGAGDFLAARDRFVADNGELKRSGDARHFPESYSPLHRANPNMLPMTYYGISMLHELHESFPNRWVVPPLQSSSDMAGGTVTLLETMPGAFLNAIGFEFAVYKRYKKARNALQNRRIILDNLSIKSGIDLPNIAELREDCLANDDCLDSVIAAVTAACWAQNADEFRHPNRDELPAAKLEGWIYVPKLQSAE